MITPIVGNLQPKAVISSICYVMCMLYRKSDAKCVMKQRNGRYT